MMTEKLSAHGHIGMTPYSNNYFIASILSGLFFTMNQLSFVYFFDK